LVERLEPVGGVEFGLVEFDGVRRRVCTACVPDADPGDFVIVHAGLAITRIDADEAARLLRHLAEMAEAEEGAT
jgi:hydrogenase expression/formation protein HypC